MSNERPPLLSDNDLMGMMFVTEDGKRPSEKIRDHYEDLITDGKLRVVEEVEWSKYCSVCDWKLEMDSAYTYCPGCGNKIKR